MEDQKSDPNLNVETEEVSSLNGNAGILEESLVEKTLYDASNLCDFTSKWANGLAVHVATIHEISINTRNNEEELRIQKLTQKYWETGVLESSLQVYINALVDVEKADLDEAVKVGSRRN